MFVLFQFLKAVMSTYLLIIGLSQYCYVFQKSYSESCATEFMTFSLKIKVYMKKVWLSIFTFSRISTFQISNRIANSFNKKQFTLRVSIVCSKIFYTMDHKILFKKYQKYRIRHQYLDWFKSYLNF